MRIRIQHIKICGMQLMQGLGDTYIILNVYTEKNKNVKLLISGFTLRSWTNKRK